MSVFLSLTWFFSSKFYSQRRRWLWCGKYSPGNYVIFRRKSSCMAIADHSSHKSHHFEGKLWRLCPFWQPGGTSSSSSSTQNLQTNSQFSNQNVVGSDSRSSSSHSVSSVARSLLPARRRLRLDPSSNLYFPCEYFQLVLRFWAQSYFLRAWLCKCFGCSSWF